jgi:DNA-binding transcriptional LysR family regulator
MSLDKMKRVARAWNWLPTFRAAGETQRFGGAGAALGISTSAVSRAVRLLERDLGHDLFDRVGRSVHLNESGRALLDAVRVAMRVIDEAIGELDGGRPRGPVRVTCDEPFASLFVLPILPMLERTHPHVVPFIERASAADIANLLTRGDVDVSIGTRRPNTAGVESEWLGRVSFGDYVGPRHALYRRRHVPSGELQSAARAVLLPSGTMQRADVAPRAGATLVTDDLDVLVQATIDGRYLIVLPDAVAARHPAQRRVRAESRAPLDVYVSRRTRLEVPTRADAVVEAILHGAGVDASK